LINSRDPRAIEPLIALLKDTNNNTRLFAAFALAQIRDPRVIDPFIVLLKETDAGTRLSGMALGQTSDPRAIQPLVDLLRDANVNVRSSAAFALGQVHDPRCTALLVEVLKEANVTARTYAAAALIRIHDPRATMPLSASAVIRAAKARFDAAYSDDKPAHTVTLTTPFYMGKYDVTQEQYQQVIGTNPSNFKGKDNPVEQVSWDDAQAFCKNLSEQTKQAVRLPTEAEWEYGAGLERRRPTIQAIPKPIWLALRGTARIAMD